MSLPAVFHKEITSSQTVVSIPSMLFGFCVHDKTNCSVNCYDGFGGEVVASKKLQLNDSDRAFKLENGINCTKGIYAELDGTNLVSIYWGLPE